MLSHVSHAVVRFASADLPGVRVRVPGAELLEPGPAETERVAGKAGRAVGVRGRGGFRVHRRGLCATSRAAQMLGEAGIETRTLRAHLAQRQRVDTGEQQLRAPSRGMGAPV
jgi:hypothetical protein